jgi:glycosyltransferase involved in cell wall biosynthesis
VKEADALSEAGYEVTVLYCFWSEWALQADAKLLNIKKWKSFLIGGAPLSNKVLYYYTRLRTKLCKELLRVFRGVALLDPYVQCRCYSELLNKARSIRADLYIAHNLGALPVALRAAHSVGAKFGFDAEDFHRGESVSSDSLQSQLVKRIEDSYLPQVNYLTVASPLIGEAYQELYPALEAHVINNVFSIQDRPSRLKCSTRQSLQLFWFSQTIGVNRGIEEAIQAIGVTRKPDICLHLLGFCTEAMKIYLKNLSADRGLVDDQLVFMSVVAPDQLVSLSSQFDIGLALEPGFSTNNDIALSNKILTYVLAGNAVIASNTRGQAAFMQQYPAIGKTYIIGNVEAFASQIMYFYENRAALNECRKNAWELGQRELNWEKEQTKFLALVDSVLS